AWPRCAADAARQRRRGNRMNSSPAFGRPWRMKNGKPLADLGLLAKPRPLGNRPMASCFLYRRREFITLLGGAATAWPLRAGAQRGEGVRRIGVLMSVAEDGPEGQARLAAFLKGLQQWGWTEGRNVRIDTRWGGGDAERTRKNVAELLALGPDVFLASGDHP